MSKPVPKVLKAFYNDDMYMVFLTEDDTVETCIVFRSNHSIGEHLDFSDLPWELRQQYEQFICPNP